MAQINVKHSNPLPSTGIAGLSRDISVAVLGLFVLFYF